MGIASGGESNTLPAHSQTSKRGRTPNRALTVCFYAHKGGVGKTTLLWEMAAHLSRRQKNVIVVDADPQMNSTFWALGRAGIEADDALLGAFVGQRKEHEHVVEAFRGTALGRPLPTLYSYLAIDKRTASRASLLKVDRMPGVSFLLGSPYIAALEAQLMQSVHNEQHMPGMAPCKHLFRRLLDDLSPLTDLILVDMAPSAGIMNQNILASCDRFVVPVTPDTHSLLGLTLLASYLPEWDRTHAYVTKGVPLARKLLAGVYNRSSAGSAALDSRMARCLATINPAAPLLFVDEWGAYATRASVAHDSLLDLERLADDEDGERLCALQQQVIRFAEVALGSAFDWNVDTRDT